MRPVVMLLAFFASGSALAQQVDREEGFDAHGFQLAAFDGDLRDPTTVHRAGRLTSGEWFLGGLLEYANAPLVAVTTAADGTKSATAVLDHLVVANFSGGVALHERVRLDAALPVYFVSVDGDRAPQGAALGDLRTTAMVAIVRPDAADEGLGVGLSLHLDVPTGSPRRFLGQRSVAGGGRLLASYARGALTFSGELGLQLNPAIELDNLVNADQLIVGVAAGYQLTDRSSLTLELRTLPAFQTSMEHGTQSPTEILLSGRYRTRRGGHLLVGVGAGLPRGVGAARARVFLGGGFGRVVRKDLSDEDGDGVIGEMDGCPMRPETVNGYLDTDGCPDALGSLSVDARFAGEGLMGAEVVLRDSEGREQRFTTEAARRIFEAMPGSDWRAEASVDCVAGTGKAQVGEGRSDLVIRMDSVRDTTVGFVVVDEVGEPVPGAVVRWQSERLGCAPEEALALATDGTGVQDLGEGPATLIVEAPGYRIHRDELDLRGESVELRVELAPAKVAIEGEQIRILEKVFFETGSAVISEVSFGLLDEVSVTIQAHRELGRIEVQGHTDDQGDDTFNLELSQQRAGAVQAYLMDSGVSVERLAAVGYGETRPVDDNSTTAGRDANRRVEFRIVTDVETAPE